MEERIQKLLEEVKVADDVRQFKNSEKPVKRFDTKIKKEYNQRGGHDLPHQLHHSPQGNQIVANPDEKNHGKRYQDKFDIRPILDIAPNEGGDEEADKNGNTPHRSCYFFMDFPSARHVYQVFAK